MLAWMSDGKRTHRIRVESRLVAQTVGVFEIDSIVLEHEGTSYRPEPVVVEAVNP
jgi:hypothetical protein